MKKLLYQTALEKSTDLAEVELSYKTIIKKSELPRINCSEDAYKLLLNIWDDLKSIDYVETFVILLVNKANKVLGWYKVSTGGVSGTVADPKIIFQAALLSNASGIILAHNHPSGNTSPSDADIKLTAKLTQAGKFLEIPILDHIIITDERYFSFADEGRL